MKIFQTWMLVILGCCAAWAQAQHAHHGAHVHHDHAHHDSAHQDQAQNHPQPAAPAVHAGHDNHDSHDAHEDSPWPAPDADTLAAAFPDLRGVPVHVGAHTAWKASLNRLEWQQGDGEESLAWRASAWWGGDIDRLRLQSHGSRNDGRSHLKTGLYWQRLITPWWETRLGLRQDSGTGPLRAWLVTGFEGRTPWFVDAAASLAWGENGHVELALESGHDWRFTQRLLLRADVELRFRNRDDAEAGLSRGFSEAEAGLRLRHEIHRQFAPYVGVEWTLRPGSAGGHDRESHRLVAGLRVWF